MGDLPGPAMTVSVLAIADGKGAMQTKYKLLVSLTILAICLLPRTATSGSPREDFNDENILKGAIAQVKQMSPQELDSFITFMASCSASDGAEVRAFHCEKEREVFLIKYGRGRTLDRLIRVLDVTWTWIKASDRVAKANSKAKEEVGDAILRYVEVMSKLKEAANDRSRIVFK